VIAALIVAAALTVSDAWSRPAIGTGVVYMRVNNRGNTADRLDAARTPVARVVEIHQSMDESKSMPGMKMDGMKMTGVMSMQRVRALTIPAHGSVTLSPGGYHLMAIDLRHDLHPNTQFPLQLHLMRAGWMTISVSVRPI
jgi:copper(I)-binding protein